jgi:sec-independent protein translocase protein TatA
VKEVTIAYTRDSSNSTIVPGVALLEDVMFRGLFQPTHLLVILVICILIFPKRLGEFGKVLGEGIRALKDATAEKSAEGSKQPKA